MRTVTIKEAKAKLNELVDAAIAGEQVIILRGSKLVAAITAVSAEELELPVRLTDPQAERFWSQIAEERAKGVLQSFRVEESAVEYLKSQRKRRTPTAKSRR